MATTTGFIDHTDQGSTPATPGAGHSRVFTKSDGLYVVDDAGGVTGPMVASAGSGSVATDAIWDAAGDLAQGTGANTAAKLTLGAANKVLYSTGSAAAWGYLPFHGAKAYNTANQTINNTSAALTLDAEEYDTDGFHDNASNNSRMTIPAAMGGYYSLKGGVGVNAANNGWIGFKLNGTTLIRGLADSLGSASQYYQAVADVQLAAGDYVELFVATDANMTVGGGGTDNQKWFSIQLMGV